MSSRVQWNKKGLSLVIGYVLLIAISIVMSIIVYSWLKTYVPKETLKCPEGTSLFIKEIEYTCTPGKETLNITVKNNGKFSINGYFIHVSNKSGEELPTIDISSRILVGGKISGNSIVFSESINYLTPDEPTNVRMSSFNVTGYGQLYKIEIIPIRIQEEDNKKRTVSCGDAKVEEVLTCYVECVPDDISVTCGTWTCGQRVNNCGNLVSCPPGCTEPDVCNSLGQCIPPAQCTDTCATYGYECGTWTICGVSTTCGSYGGGCQTGYECNIITGKCVALCGNGVINSGETCDDGNIASGDGCSSSCTIESGFVCSGEPSTCTTVSSCPSYCVSLGYTTGACTNSAGNCQNSGGVYQSGGDQWCTGGEQADTCCCTT